LALPRARSHDGNRPDRTTLTPPDMGIFPRTNQAFRLRIESLATSVAGAAAPGPSTGPVKVDLHCTGASKVSRNSWFVLCRTIQAGARAILRSSSKRKSQGLALPEITFHTDRTPPSMPTATKHQPTRTGESARIDSGIAGLKLAVYELQAASRAGTRAALYVHGATFPAQLSMFHTLDGVSWAGHLSAANFHVYAFDQLGFGESDRYPEMLQAADLAAPLGRADAVAQQIERVVAHIRAKTGVEKIHLIAHSWGTLAAALFAQHRPEFVERLALFAPIAQRRPAAAGVAPGSASPADAPAWHCLTIEKQRARFAGYVPQGRSPVLDPEHFARWADAYLASDAQSGEQDPPSVKVPFGPVADLGDALGGRLAYDPAGIKVPTLIVRGEWDETPDDADARWLFDALVNAPLKRDVKISRGTHVMHLEESRFALYREVLNFFEGGDIAVPDGNERPRVK